MTIQQYVFKRGKIQSGRKFPTRIEISPYKRKLVKMERQQNRYRFDESGQTFVICIINYIAFYKLKRLRILNKKIEFEICYLSVFKSKLECFNRPAFDIIRESKYLKPFNCPKLRGKTNKYILNFHDEISQNVPFFQSYLKGKTYLKA